jgi:hypothetical protein
MKLIQVGIDLRRFLRDRADSFDDLSDLAHGTLRVWTRSVAASIAWTAETRVCSICRDRIRCPFGVALCLATQQPK